MGPALLLALLSSPTAQAAGGDPRKFYAAFALPIEGFGVSSTGWTLLQFNLTPVTVEYGIAPRWGLRVAPHVGLALTVGDGVSNATLTDEGGRLEVPCYFGDRTLHERMVGGFAGPYAAASSTYGVGALTGGASGGFSLPVGVKLRVRLGGRVGVVYTMDGSGLGLDLGGVVEVGGLLF